MFRIRLEELQAARTRALKAVLYPDTEYFWRKLCRWACDHLNLSVYEAEAMPLSHLLRHYHEWQVEQMDEDQRARLLAKVTETKEQAEQREVDEEVDEQEIDDLLALAQEEAKRNASKSGYRFMDKDEAKKQKGKPTPPPAPETDDMPNLSELPPDVEVKFVDSVEDEVGWDLFGKQSSK